MSRIRSIHPGFFSDEDIVSTSMAARMLFLGLGVEADDKGIFEWKPLTIKMRVFPGDNLDVAALLVELEGAGAIRRYELNGKSYGAIRNFRKFQKPKTPNDIYPATPEMLAFVGLPSETKGDEAPSFPPKGETFLPKGEKSFQMEDGGGRGEEKEETPLPPLKGERADYPFVGKVVRLNRQDYNRWRKQFSAIPDFDAELVAVDGWLAGQSEAKQAKWFGSCAPWLNKRHQEALERANPRAAESSFSGAC